MNNLMTVNLGGGTYKIEFVREYRYKYMSSKNITLSI